MDRAEAERLVEQYNCEHPDRATHTFMAMRYFRPLTRPSYP
jgi:hypothetical protein